MQYHQLGNSSLNVSALCLGTMTWGEQNNQQEAFEQLDYAIDQGINFIDTAELYPVPPKAETYTKTESIIGEWIKQRANRDQFILATKVTGPGDWVSYMRLGPRLDRHNIITAAEASLARLNTDYIDLYQVHWPERQTNFFGQLNYPYSIDEQIVAIEETLSALNELVISGKVRHIGISNETPWGAMQYLQLAEKHGMAQVVSIQNPYNLLNRTFEIGLAEFAHREQLSLLAYSPMAFGALSGKYLHGAKPANARLTLFSRFARYSNPQAIKATEQYVAIAKQHNLDPAQMALAFVSSRPFVTSNIIGATSMEQLKANIASINLTLADEVLEEIEAVHTEQPNPAP
ncbi:NADP(H)-dependent aldo-keto reductase [Endozoicomonas sp. SM1973]|uniref:Protein tas n=1 Tax=Spartinivicinus marinus TaxID=2994442 RepID=A0A853I4I8_9GAMM|nr:NADP(H)-dependent aldo-keto reductase [Spartinivicinus marinus]MCX4028293.1 NADP(H)-dependent aldo-keto reductase [Spartinivicinus marinus]NYZ65628.1 NADP(H)-dependent aldo-keto reductase [Spartinivicinus marinus]